MTCEYSRATPIYVTLQVDAKEDPAAIQTIGRIGP
jgi:hypothetical protein